jgi:hypothetical protein
MIRIKNSLSGGWYESLRTTGSKDFSTQRQILQKIRSRVDPWQFKFLFFWKKSLDANVPRIQSARVSQVSIRITKE